MESIPYGIAGVYRILCVITGKIYIGSSVDVRERWLEHIRGLRAGRHHSRYLLRAWQKYGPDAFRFELLERIDDPALCVSREQHYIDTLRPFERHVGYNLSRQASTTLGVKHTLEARQRMSHSHRGRRHSDEHVRNQALSVSHDWVLTAPWGEEFHVRGLRDFCNRYGLDHRPLCEVAQGKRYHHKGWQCRRAGALAPYIQMGLEL